MKLKGVGLFALGTLFGLESMTHLLGAKDNRSETIENG